MKCISYLHSSSHTISHKLSSIIVHYQSYQRVFIFTMVDESCKADFLKTWTEAIWVWNSMSKKLNAFHYRERGHFRCVYKQWIAYIFENSQKFCFWLTKNLKNFIKFLFDSIFLKPLVILLYIIGLEKWRTMIKSFVSNLAQIDHLQQWKVLTSKK